MATYRINLNESWSECNTIESQRHHNSAEWNNNDPFGDDDDDDDDDDMSASRSFEFVVSVVVPTIFGLITAVGLVGNLLVIVVVAFNRRTITTTNVLIVNLAVADLLFIVICVPFTAVGYATPVWPFGDVWCKIYQYAVHVTTYASVYTLVMMSFDRYLAVVHPVRSMAVRTERNASIVAAVSWVLILAFNYPVIIEHKSVEYDFDGEVRSACVNAFIYQNVDGDDHNYHDRGKAYYACFFAFAYVIPLAAVSVLYGLMIKRLLRGTRPGARQTATGDRSRGKRRVTRLVVAVVVTFAVCWLPLQLVLVVQFVGRYTNHSLQFVAVKIACSCLAYTNSCLNPILYAFLSENFRKSFRRLLCLVLCGAGSRCRGRDDLALHRTADDRKAMKDRGNTTGKHGRSVARIDAFETNEGLINHYDDCVPEKTTDASEHHQEENIVQQETTVSKF